MQEYSYTPIDVGFDLRLHPEIAIELPAGDTLRVRFCDGDEERTLEAPRSEVASALSKAGYTVA